HHLRLALLELGDLLLDGAAGEEAIGDDGTVLADAVRAVDRLRLDCRVPPRVEENDIARGGEIESGTTGLERNEEHAGPFVGLEGRDDLLALDRLSGEH